MIVVFPDHTHLVFFITAWPNRSSTCSYKHTLTIKGKRLNEMYMYKLLMFTLYGEERGGSCWSLCCVDKCVTSENLTGGTVSKTFQHQLSTGKLLLTQISNSYTMDCQPARGDNPRALASGLSYVQVDKHCITISYHLHQYRPCTSRDITC